MAGGRSATEIRVHEYRQILIWPFRLGAGNDPLAERNRAAKLLPTGTWVEASNLAEHLPTSGDVAVSQQEGYQEFTYFHPFVRSLLFDSGQGDVENRQIRLFRREDVIAADIGFENEMTGPFSLRFKIERLNLYLFDTGVAILVVEFHNDGMLEGGAPMNLAHALTLLERLRRAYPPFWRKNDAAPGFSPSFVRWLSRDGDQHEEPPLTADEVHNRPWSALTSPIASHWAWLLRPLYARGDSLFQIIDDRIPLMTYLRVDDPTQISDFDWMRLAMCDEPGKDARTPPYGKEFMARLHQDYSYDRHWITDEEDRVVVEKSSRYLFSGFGFVTVGAESNSFYADIFPKHFRRHYFQMALLAHVERATLLVASQCLPQSSDETADAALERVIRFTKSYWFSDVSPQVQAKEMFARWRRQLETQTLYSQVLDAARNVAQFNEAKEARRGAEATTRLTVAALLVAVPTLATGFLGMNVLVDDDSALGALKGWGHDGWMTVLWALGLAGALISFLFGLAVALTRKGGTKRLDLRYIVGLTAAALLAAAVLWPRPPG